MSPWPWNFVLIDCACKRWKQIFFVSWLKDVLSMPPLFARPRPLINLCLNSLKKYTIETQPYRKSHLRQSNDNILISDIWWASLYLIFCRLRGCPLILFSRAGFGDPMKMCCGVEWEDKHVWCGQAAILNGTKLYADSCGDPSSFISWDGVHYTEAANRWFADRIINGSFSDQHSPISHSCHRF